MFIGSFAPRLHYLLHIDYTYAMLDAAYEIDIEDIIDFAAAWCGV